MLIFYKTIDKSVLSAGFSIPVTYKEMLLDNLGFSLAHGEKTEINGELILWLIRNRFL